MKKIIISLFACFALVFGALIAWSCYLDLLAGSLFLCALLPSVLFEEGCEECAKRRYNTEEYVEDCLLERKLMQLRNWMAGGMANRKSEEK